MFFELIQKDNRQGNNFFQTPMQLEEEAAQETMDKMKEVIAVEAEFFGIRNLSFGAGSDGYEKTGRQPDRRQRHSKIEQDKNKRQQYKRQNGGNMK